MPGLIGWSDVGVSSQDVEIAASGVEKLLPKKLRIFSSDLERAEILAREIATRRNLTYKPLRNFREINFGLWEGSTWENIQRIYPQDYKSYMARWKNMPFPEGESYPSFEKRVGYALEEVGPLSENILVVAHAGVIRMIARIILKYSEEEALGLPLDFGRLSCLDVTSKTITYWNKQWPK